MKINNLRTIILAISALISSTAFADSLEGYLKKMTSVIEKDGRALFCIAKVPTGKRETSEMLWPKTAQCIGEVTIGSGMKERTGCAAFNLDVNNLNTTGVGSDGRQKIIEGKKCDVALEQLMGLNLQGYYDEPAGKNEFPVGWTFYDGVRVDFMKPVIVYSKKPLFGSSKYEAWWNKKRAEVVAEESKKRKTASEDQ
ncbi:MAG: hypothetical protein AAGB31_12410 [Bdellovibrio sp.]